MNAVLERPDTVILDEAILDATAMCVANDGGAEWKVSANCCGAYAIVCSRHMLWHRRQYEPDGTHGRCLDCGRFVHGANVYEDLYTVTPV